MIGVGAGEPEGVAGGGSNDCVAIPMIRLLARVWVMLTVPGPPPATAGRMPVATAPIGVDEVPATLKAITPADPAKPAAEIDSVLLPAMGFLKPQTHIGPAPSFLVPNSVIVTPLYVAIGV